jgi:hypothetical protein
LSRRVNLRIKSGDGKDSLYRQLVQKQKRVTRGLDPRVHLFGNKFLAKKMDCRVKTRQ